MTPFRLSSADLDSLATQLRQEARAQEASLARQRRQWNTQFSSLRSTGFVSGHRRLDGIADGIAELIEHRHAAAAVFAYTVLAQHGLESAYDQVVRTARDLGVLVRGWQAFPTNHRAVDASVLVTLVLRDLKNMGAALDTACSLQIDALTTHCAPAFRPTIPLGAWPTVPASDIDAQNRRFTTPEIRALLEKYPEATLLETGAGEIAVAFGDIDSAQSITTLVAGVGSSNQDSWGGYLDRAQRISHRTSSATIMWLGYSAPDNLVDAVGSQPARTAAPKLSEFQRALRERNPEAKLVVLGHSYGSVVASHAAREGLDADTLIYAGSPGVRPDPQLRSKNPKVIGALADADPIGMTGTTSTAVHGIDPHAKNSPYERWATRGDHSSYFCDEVFLEALAKEVAP